MVHGNAKLQTSLSPQQLCGVLNHILAVLLCSAAEGVWEAEGEGGVRYQLRQYPGDDGTFVLRWKSDPPQEGADRLSAEGMEQILRQGFVQLPVTLVSTQGA